MEFRKMDGTKVSLETYIRDYLKLHPTIEIIIGCDSQNRGKCTYYAVVVALYTPGSGAHVVFSKWKSPKEYTRAVRLLNEAWYAVETAEALRESGLPKPNWIDLDLNPDPKYKSNEVFNQAVGLCEGMGYKVRFKTLGPLVTAMADSIVRS
jgi:predicted RNase H-related nuclease YkuK (DUF458 family)